MPRFLATYFFHFNKQNPSKNTWATFIFFISQISAQTNNHKLPAPPHTSPPAMSSAAVASPTKKATKPVVKKTKKTAEEAVVAAAVAVEAPVAAAPPAAPAKRGRAKKAAPSDAAVNVEVPAVAVSAPPAPTKKAGGKKRAKPSDEEEEGEIVAATPAAADGEAAAKKAKKPREIKPKVVYIEGYGDLFEKAENERDFSEEEFKRWQEATALRAANQKFKDWVRAKKTFYKNIKTLLQSRKRKRQQKPLDNTITSETHYNRILANIPKTDFLALNNTWLSGHGFDGIYSADALAADKNAISEGAFPTYTVYRAAVASGAAPLGIVSENKKKNAETGAMEYVHNTGGNRTYVGIALPFQKLEASPFSILPADRAFLSGADSETAE